MNPRVALNLTMQIYHPLHLQIERLYRQSGTDTNVIGSQVIGNQIIANVGTSGTGNLNIQSLQDSNTFKDKQSNFGVSVSLCIPPFCYGASGGSVSAGQSKINSNYASVNEQAGFFAGDGGYQANVNGNTNLTGAVMASTDKAIQDHKNNLTTQTLTISNIENSAEYSAKGASFSAGVGLNKQPNGTFKNAPTASAGSSNLSDDSSSVTVSGISGGSLTITNNAQQALTGQDTATTVATLNRDIKTQLNTTTDENGNTQTIATAVDSQGNNLASTLKPIFDQDQVQRELSAQIQITQAFSQVAPKAVADYAANKVKELKDTNPAEAAKWDEGGIYRIALHTALGGLLMGDISGAAGAGVVAGSADLLNTLQSKVTQSLQSAGLESTDPTTGEKVPSQAANTIAQALAELTSIGIGSAIGGAAGAGTALVVDTNNRQLHTSEIQRAKDLYKLAQKLGLPYTLAQIEDTLRGANNSQYGETATSNIIYNPNAPAGQNNQSSTDMYTGTATDLMNPGTTNGAWTYNPQTGALIQSIPTSSADLIGFVQTYTGGSNSVYSWNASSPSATIDYSNVVESNFLNSRNSCFGECGQVKDLQTGKWMWVPATLMGQAATAGQFGGNIGMYEPHSALDDTKILAGTAAAAVLVALAPEVVVASPTAAAVGAGTSGAVNATTQYVKYGEIKYPAELISSTVLGGVAGPLMANGGLVANITYGGGFATLNSVFTNTYYTPLEKERDNLVESFVFGGIGGGTGKWLDSYLVKSWISGIPQYVRPQGYNPELGALLNPVSAINSQYGSSVLVKDIASGLTGAGTETLTKETWGKVNTK